MPNNVIKTKMKRNHKKIKYILSETKSKYLTKQNDFHKITDTVIYVWDLTHAEKCCNTKLHWENIISWCSYWCPHHSFSPQVLLLINSPVC